MRDTRAEVFRCLAVAVLFLLPFAYADGNVTEENRVCDTLKALEQCRRNERCMQDWEGATGHCECLIHYHRVGGQCVHVASMVTINATTVQPDVKSSSGGSSVAAGLLIPTFLVVIGVLLYLGARRYKWLQRFRQFRQNRYGNVLVTRDDDDDDDPPIA